MIHIVFNEADIEALAKSFELDGTLLGEIIQVKDDYAVGPLKNIYSEEGILERKEWWKEVLAGGDYDGKVENGEVDDNKMVLELKEKLTEDPSEKVWIWAAQNKHDVCGYYWLMSQLSDFQGRIFILYLNNLPFINEKGLIFYPEWLHTIPAKEFVKAKKLARPITPSEFEIDPDEWTKLCNDEKGVRLLEGGKKLAQHDYNFYDEELNKFINGNWQSAHKIVNNFINKAVHKTGDAYILWRLKQLLSTDKYDVQGDAKKMKDFEVKQKATQLETEASPG